MNAHQRRKFAKALIADLKNATEDEKLQELIVAAVNSVKQEQKLMLQEDCIAELKSKLDWLTRENNELAARIGKEINVENEALKDKLALAVETLDKTLYWTCVDGMSLFSRYSVVVDTLHTGKNKLMENM